VNGYPIYFIGLQNESLTQGIHPSERHHLICSERNKVAQARLPAQVWIYRELPGVKLDYSLSLRRLVFINHYCESAETCLSVSDCHRNADCGSVDGVNPRMIRNSKCNTPPSYEVGLENPSIEGLGNAVGRDKPKPFGLSFQKHL